MDIAAADQTNLIHHNIISITFYLYNKKSQSHCLTSPFTPLTSTTTPRHATCKSFDDSFSVGFIADNKEEEYREVVENHLQLNFRNNCISICCEKWLILSWLTWILALVDAGQEVIRLSCNHLAAANWIIMTNQSYTNCSCSYHKVVHLNTHCCHWQACLPQLHPSPF